MQDDVPYTAALFHNTQLNNFWISIQANRACTRTKKKEADAPAALSICLPVMLFSEYID